MRYRLLIATAHLLALNACTPNVPIDRPPTVAAVAVTEGEGRSLQLQRIALDMPPDTRLGTVSGGSFCSISKPLTLQGRAWPRMLRGDRLVSAFAAEIKQAQYRLVGGPDTLLDDAKADLLIAGLDRKSVV